MEQAESLEDEIRRCNVCAARFRATPTMHEPRPVAWFKGTARVLIAGQAPGARVHRSGRPFTDPSGDRLREWMGVSSDIFYDKTRIAIVPMALCFPGYDAKGSDLPPPAVCAKTWRARILGALPKLRLTLVIGKYALRYHLDVPAAARVTDIVSSWRDAPDGMLPLPHPSWRNTAWMNRNPWFRSELVPELRRRVSEALA